MKLLQKTGKNYLLFTSILLVVTGCLIYFIMTSIIEEELTDNLYVNKVRITQQIMEGKTVPQLPPIIEIQELDFQQESNFIIKDTNIYDPNEQDFELFKEVTSVEDINGKTYVITVREILLEPEEYLYNIGLSLAIVMILLLFGLFLINKRISRNIWKPFYNNLEILKSYSLEKDNHIRLQSSDINEFTELNFAIEKLTDKIYTDYHTLKEFSENASHEMQTPLAIIQTKLEEAVQAPSLTKQQAGQIKSALAAVQRLSKLNHTLLFLTKLENRQFTDSESINFEDVIDKVLEQFEDFIQLKNLNIKKQLNPTIIQANPVLMDILLSNLISNAIKHNNPKGILRIELGSNSFTISNTSKPLTQPAEKMFERFVKADQSSKSLGLGLAIVKKICDSNSWKINYTNEGEWHVIKIYF
ncbi:MAG: HAMP domain-containing histidine kinase [Ignavibacteria bacterium]|nr:HAMP domain-containing histidine kinase [Ignavibacteria bacterium]